MLKFGLFAMALLSPSFVCADVADSAAGGFTVKLAVTIQAPPQLVYAKLINNVGDWWNPMHTFTGDAHMLTIEDKPMGCFCERRLNGTGAIRHMEVINIDRNKTLVLSGALGPLQSLAATGTMSIQLEPAGEGTKLSVVYAVVGYQPNGLATWAPIVDSVITEQFTRFKNFVETGKPENGQVTK
jgi:uncharacterized protein YndB with AHSA1/START domain